MKKGYKNKSRKIKYRRRRRITRRQRQRQRGGGDTKTLIGEEQIREIQEKIRTLLPGNNYFINAIPSILTAMPHHIYHINPDFRRSVTMNMHEYDNLLSNLDKSISEKNATGVIRLFKNTNIDNAGTDSDPDLSDNEGPFTGNA
jgi:hypothetical protein